MDYAPITDAHDPALYDAAACAATVSGLEAITDEHIDFYFQEGYLAVENALDRESIETAKSALLDLIMGRVPGFDGVMFERGAAERLETLTLDERQDAVRKLMGFVNYEPRLFAVADEPRLLAVIERILGERPKLSQDMALIKPPRLGREKPWHQDHAYFDYPLGTRVVGVWLALDKATIANGCMHLRPRAHHTGPMVHFKRRD